MHSVDFRKFRNVYLTSYCSHLTAYKVRELRLSILRGLAPQQLVATTLPPRGSNRLLGLSVSSLHCETLASAIYSQLTAALRLSFTAALIKGTLWDVSKMYCLCFKLMGCTCHLCNQRVCKMRQMFLMDHYYSGFFNFFLQLKLSSLFLPHSVSVAVRAGELRESEGVLPEGAEPPEGPLQGHVSSRHRLLSPGWLRMCPALPAWCQESWTHRWE